jgi:hypothetical protein
MIQHDNPNVEWFTEAAITITCHWDGGSQAALYRDDHTNEFDFNPICKVSESVLSDTSIIHTLLLTVSIP